VEQHTRTETLIDPQLLSSSLTLLGFLIAAACKRSEHRYCDCNPETHFIFAVLTCALETPERLL